LRVLLTGANGFIGRYLLAGLLSAGHEVVPAVRDPRTTDALLPRKTSIHADFNSDTRAEIWLPRLKGIDAVINCAGILQGRPGQSIEAIHTAAPRALFEACERASVKRVIQISAISANPDAHTEYARRKADADAFLMERKLDWVILRPSLVYAQGAYGGTALFRALAALPFAIPVPGRGDQQFQPIFMADLVQTVLKILADTTIARAVIEPVGPERLMLSQILIDLRRWLGFPRAHVVHVPIPLIRFAASVGDLAGGSINSTALKQMEYGNVGAVDAFVKSTGIQPQRWSDVLAGMPAQVQDRWHARLYFLRPAFRIAIALTWLGSGLAGLLQRPPIELTTQVFGHALPSWLYSIACALDIVIGLAVLLRIRPKLMAAIQVLLVAFYTAFLTIVQPLLWIEPFGPLLKNIPFVVAVLALAVLESER
jgi:uncharacterized protein YbjT (DUF2867 family)